METALVVWNLDARNRPELEVEIDIVCALSDVPGEHYASARPDLEVELDLDLTDLAEEISDPWLTVSIFDRPPQGYADAYRASV